MPSNNLSWPQWFIQFQASNPGVSPTGAYAIWQSGAAPTSLAQVLAAPNSNNSNGASLVSMPGDTQDYESGVGRNAHYAPSAATSGASIPEGEAYDPSTGTVSPFAYGNNSLMGALGEGTGGAILGLAGGAYFGGLGAGAGATGAAGSTTAGTTAGAAASGAPTLAEIAAAAPGESFVGPATGTVLEPGVQASGGALASAAPGVGAPTASALATGAGDFLPSLGTIGTAATGATLADNLANAASDPNTNYNSGPADQTQGQTGDPNSPGVGADGVTTVPTPSGTTTTPPGVWDRIANGTASAADWAQIAGNLAPGILGLAGSSQMSDAYRHMYDDSVARRQPFLDQSRVWMADPSTYINGPGQTALQGVLRGLSVNGNPINNPTSLSIATDASMRNWQSAVTGFGNLGLSGEDTRANIGSNAIQAQGNEWNALGYGLNNALNPRGSGPPDWMRSWLTPGPA